MTRAAARVPTRTPPDLEFRPRNEKFELEALLATDWAGGDPVRTAFWNALSSLFPVGEQFFMDSVRPFMDRIQDERMRRDVRAFCGQEAVHSREHQRYNEALCAARGVDLAALEARMRRNLAYARENVPPVGHLAVTVAYEHFTAILAHQILTEPSWTEEMPAEMRRLWIWHAIEETEHKAVAFDVFMAVNGKRKHLRRALLYVSHEFTSHILRNGMLLLRGSGIPGPVAFARLSALTARLMWAAKGDWMDFFRGDFHPWRHDNRAVLAQALAAYGRG